MKHHDDQDIVWSSIERQIGVLLREEPAGECLSFDDLMALTERRRNAPRYYEAMNHLLRCKECKQTYLELQALRSARKRRRNASAVSSPWRTSLLWGTPAAAMGILFIWLRMFLSQPGVVPKLVAQGEPETSAVSVAIHEQAPKMSPSFEVPPRFISQTKPQKPERLFLRDHIELEIEKVSQKLNLNLSISFLQNLLNKLPSYTTSKVVVDTKRGGDRGDIRDPDSPVQVRVIHPHDIGTNLAVEPCQTITLELKTEHPSDEMTLKFRLQKKFTDEVISEEPFVLSGASQTLEIRLSELTTPISSDGTIYRLVIQPSDDHSIFHVMYEFRFLRDTSVENAPSELQQLELARQIREIAPLLAAKLFENIDRTGDALETLKCAQQQYPELPEIDLWIQELKFKQQRLRKSRP